MQTLISNISSGTLSENGRSNYYFLEEGAQRVFAYPQRPFSTPTPSPREYQLDMLTKCQQSYFDRSIKHKAVRDCISSLEEFEFKKILSACGFKEDKDYFHQAAFTDDEDFLFVADFSFPNDKIIIELDGSSHHHKSQIRKDRQRDKTFLNNEYETIRIKTPLTQEDKCFWKVFIQETIDQIRNAKADPLKNLSPEPQEGTKETRKVPKKPRYKKQKLKSLKRLKMSRIIRRKVITV